MTEAGLARQIDLTEASDHPERLLWMDRTTCMSLKAAEVAEVQLSAVRARFGALLDRLPVLRNLAAEQGVDSIETLNDAAPLLFKHSVYKSYPVSFIERGRFDRMTQWLQNLTTADLSPVRTEGITSIDEWLDALLRDAGVRIIHSTGTSGKLSFLPRGPVDRAIQLRSTRLVHARDGESEPTGMNLMPTVVIGHRIMFNGYGSGLEATLEELYNGDESMILTLDPGRLSADVLSLGGRLAAAGNKGDLGRAQIPPSLLARLDEFREAQKSAPERRARFFDALFERLQGKRVIMAGNWLMYHEMMEIGRERGAHGVFARDSLILSAGGTKGKTLPEGYREDIQAFLGVDRINEGYGMSEMTSLMPKCAAGNYHAMPWMLVYLLDPETGEPAPRHGTHTGRFGVIDLAFQERWGGVLSGDEVTMTFGTCDCGRDGPFIADTIRRYSEIEGGDDKITCAGAPEAHDKALAFLAEMD